MILLFMLLFMELLCSHFVVVCAISFLILSLLLV